MEPRKKIEVTSKQAIELAEALEVIVMKLRDELALHEANVQQVRSEIIEKEKLMQKMLAPAEDFEETSNQNVIEAVVEILNDTPWLGTSDLFYRLREFYSIDISLNSLSAILGQNTPVLLKRKKKENSSNAFVYAVNSEQEAFENTSEYSGNHPQTYLPDDLPF